MKTSKMLTFLVTVLAGAMVFTMSACEAEVETIGGANFGAPAGLTVTGATTDSISLGWNPAEGATSYKVYNSASEDGDFSEAGISDAASFTNEGLAPNTICWYKVSSINGSGESVPSPAVKGVTKSTASGGGNGSGEGGEIAAPTGLLFSGVSVNSVTLSWDVFEGAAGYKIYRSGTANGVYTQAATSDANSYTDSGLALNSTYYYKVSALVSPSG
ncbi:MAG: hypothetical protein LBG72_05670, partial [Spirochaetaceae bacterium]|nr:hypothetical protein [Spirochaetaceae bacterium]